MRHQCFPYDIAGFPDKERMKEKIAPVEPAVERENGRETFSSHNPEGASSVAQKIAGHQIPEAIGNPGDEKPCRSIAAVPSHPADHIAGFKFSQEAGDIGGVVLPVGIQGQDELSLRSSQPPHDRLCLPSPDRLGYYRNFREERFPRQRWELRGFEAPDLGNAPVVRTIIHDDYFAALPDGRIEDRSDLAQEGIDGFRFVIHRKNNRKCLK
jgi:hypothetical protein